jgi:hypothetical protein
MSQVVYLLPERTTFKVDRILVRRMRMPSPKTFTAA